MVGDEGGGRGVDGPPPVGGVGPSNTIFCLYCRATIYFPGLPANRYTNHLFSEHNIMYEVQSVINRTLALQLPKEYPELADGSISLPDSSNRTASPIPLSPAPCKGNAPSPAPTSHSVFTTEISTQTEPVTMCEGECKAVRTIKKEVQPSPTKDVSKEAGKEGLKVRVKDEVKKMLDKARQNKKLGVTCEICKVRYKKVNKLKFHILKHHAKELSAKAAKKEGGRKSSRIEHQKEEKGDVKPELPFSVASITDDQDIPTSLILPKDEEWTEGCKFFCMLCSLSFTSFGVYKHHIGNFHGMLIEEYRAKFGKHGEVISKIDCQLCGSEVVHRNSAIKGHLRSVHNMTAAQYRQRFNPERKPDARVSVDSEPMEKPLEVVSEAGAVEAVAGEEEQIEDEMVIDEQEEIDDDEVDAEDVLEVELEGPPETEGHPDMELEGAAEVEVEGAAEVEVEGAAEVELEGAAEEQEVEVEGELRRWYEGCNYICVPCNKNYDIYFSYHGHIKKIHNLSMEKYHAIYGQGRETNRYYACKICATNVVWRMFNIRKHLESQHSMTLDQYGAQYEPSGQVDTSKKLKFKDPVQTFSQSRDVPRDPLPRGPEVERDWFEGCLFTCQVEACGRVYNSIELYSKHVSGVHALTMPEYNRKYGTKGELYTQYECLICNAKIAHKYNNIASHLTLIHDLSIQEYEETYVKTKEASIGEDNYEIDAESEMYIDEGLEDEVDGEEGETYEFTEDDVIIQEEEVIPTEQIEPVTEGTEHAWYHGSNLTCKICFKNFANDQWYFHHFSKIHGITKEQYNEKYGKEGEIYHQYQCLICNSKIRWKYSSIRQHLKQVHGTNIQDYESKYMNNEPDQLTVDPIAALQEQARNPCHEVSPSKTSTPVSLPPPPPLKACPAALLAGRVSGASPLVTPPPAVKQFNTNIHSGKGAQLTFSNRPESQWYHGSDLACQICNKSFVDFTYYCTHIRTTHQLSKEQYNEKHGTTAESFRLYKCLACGISIKWTYQSICGHIKSHDLTIKDYEAKYNVLESQNTDSGKISDLTMNARAGVSANTSVVVGEGVESPTKKMRLEDVPPPLLTLPGIFGTPQQFEINSILVANSSPKPARISADISSPTGKWYNQCQFTCKACPDEKYFTVPQALRMHLNGIHDLTRKDYESRFGGAETITKYWTCLICRKELKCQKGIIIQHLLNVHQLELVDYERTHMDAGDQVVAREIRKPRKNARVPLPPPPGLPPLGAKQSNDSNDSFADSTDLSSFLLQRMQEGVENVTLDGPVITGEMDIDDEEGFEDDEMDEEDQEEEEGVDPPTDMDGAPFILQAPFPPPSHAVDTNITSISTLEVEGMDYVPWYFGCRYSCQICTKYWHYPQACRYHLDSVHKLSRAVYEAEYGSCEVETRLFHCSLCQRSMKCERDIIKYHLEAKHSMSLENYEQQVPNPVVTIGESRRSNAASSSRTSSISSVGSRTSSLPSSQFIPSNDNSPVKFVAAAVAAERSPVAADRRSVGVTDPKIPWYRGSNFTCIPCNRQFTAQVSYISHINSKHGMNLREYRDQFGSAEEIKQYTCRVPACTRYVSWTYSGINDHLKSHSLTMSEYENIYIKENVEIRPDRLERQAELWSLGESRSCSLCSRDVIGDLAAFSVHLESAHALTLPLYTAQHGSCDKQLEHKCRECEQQVQLLPGNMGQHLLGHALTLNQYYHKYVALNFESPKKPLSNGLSALKSPGGISVKSPAALLKPDAKPNLGPTSPKPLVFKVRKNHWANGCTYKCAMCPDIEFPEEFVFKKHIQLAHNMSSDQYQNNFGSSAVNLQLHSCKVCNKSVKHEYTAILNHLRVKHAMTLTAYTQMYIKPVQVPTSTTPNTPGEKKLPLTGEKLLPVAADKLPEQPLPAAADSTQQPQEQHNQN